MVGGGGVEGGGLFDGGIISLIGGVDIGWFDLVMLIWCSFIWGIFGFFDIWVCVCDGDDGGFWVVVLVFCILIGGIKKWKFNWVFGWIYLILWIKIVRFCYYMDLVKWLLVIKW